MGPEVSDVRKHFRTGAVILSLDTEQIWGYLDHMDEARFRSQYPGALGAHDRLLGYLTSAGVSATWFMVGGMALRGSDGPRDFRMTGLPAEWTARIPDGVEATAPLWYRHSFVKHLLRARPFQEVGLHGGLTHLIWTAPHATPEVLRRELTEGVKALEQAHVHPVSFSFGREQEAHHEMLAAHGIRCYRGRTVTRAFQMGPTLRGAIARLWDEVRRATPPPVWPHETLPGLWNIPSSAFLYPIRASRNCVVGLRARLERFSRGVEAAARARGIFHFCLHPENLTESPEGFALFGEMLERLTRARDRGDVEILTMVEAATRMERGRDTELPVPAEGVPVGTLTGVKGLIHDS